MSAFRHLVKALPDLFTAYLLYVTWSGPTRFGMEWFRAGAFLMLLEFFVIHAGGFMAVTVVDPQASRRVRLLRLAGWSAGYLAFISLFAIGLDAPWLVWAFAWCCFCKLQALWTGAPPTERDRSHAVTAWALSVAVYLGAVFATVMYDVPELAVSAELRKAWGFTGSGVWESEPQRALAGGVLYFALMGLLRPLLAWAFSARNAGSGAPA